MRRLKLLRAEPEACVSPTIRRLFPRQPVLAATALFPIVVFAATAASPPYPRIGSVWWGERIYTVNPAQAEKIQLFLAPNFTLTSARAVKTANPGTLILATVNAMETTNGTPAVPDSYYLLDSNGNRIQNWPGNPGNFLLNLTNPAVAPFMAQYAWQKMTQTGVVYDGLFFDNFQLTISNYASDYAGNPVQINNNYPEPPDVAGVLDLKWSAGMLTLLSEFRKLAPQAYISVHAAQSVEDPRAFAIENGESLVFDAVNVREGRLAFGNLWNSYQQWFASGRAATIAAVQSSPPSQIAYGYGYRPLSAAPAPTVEFAQSWYPNMRFGLGVALMNNGYFIHDFGDTTSPVTWWYDEYDFDLGMPVTPATQIGSPAGANQIIDMGFNGGLAPWHLSVNNDGSSDGTAVVDNTGGVDGGPAALISVTSPGTADWHLDFQQGNVSLEAGQEYIIQFQARSSASLTFQLSMQGGTSPYPYYGLTGTSLAVGTSWAPYFVSFVAPVTATDGILEFRVGGQVGDLWLDKVQLFAAPAHVYRRDFTRGVVMLNGTASPQTIPLDPGLQRFSGSQAPRDQYIVDDSDPAFTATGPWAVNNFDTDRRVAEGPYYHAWQSTLHELDSPDGSAQWNLNVPEDGNYTIQVWLPAAPDAVNWTANAIYNVMSDGQLIATATLDQSQAAAGDQWFTLFTDLSLAAGGAPTLTLESGGSGPLIADAVYVYSSRARYNDGSAVSQVTLAPFDSILLERQKPIRPRSAR
jgi:hypothetical protein